MLNGTINAFNFTCLPGTNGLTGTNNIQASLGGGPFSTFSKQTILGASNNYTGGTMVGGTVALAVTATLGSTNNNLCIATNGLLDLGGTTQIQKNVANNGRIINGTIVDAISGKKTSYDTNGVVVEN